MTDLAKLIRDQERDAAGAYRHTSRREVAASSLYPDEPRWLQYVEDVPGVTRMEPPRRRRHKGEPPDFPVLVGLTAWGAHPEDAALYDPGSHSCAGCGGAKLRPDEFCVICSASDDDTRQWPAQQPKRGEDWDGSRNLAGGTGKKPKASRKVAG